MATKFARAMKFAKDTGGETRKANYLSTRVGRQTGARSGNAGQGEHGYLMVDAAGGHYREMTIVNSGKWG